MQQLDVSIVMVSYNVRDLCRDSLNNIISSTKDITYEIICIDNNSVDGTGEMVKSEFPAVLLIENKANKGIAFANNQGIRISRGRYIALYNPDTLTVGNAFGEMVRYLDEHPEIAALGPQLLNEDGSVQISARNGYINLWNEFCVQSGLYRYLSGISLFSGYYAGIKDVDKLQEVDQVITACMMVRREGIERIDGMDEGFFLYGDDVDFNKRLKERGLRILYNPQIKIFHLKGRSSKQFRTQVQVWSLDSINYFIRKHYGNKHALCHRGIIGMIGVSWFMASVVAGFFFPSKREHIRENITKKNLILVKWGFGRLG